MADIQRYRAHESLNTQTAASWAVQTAATAGSSASSVQVTAYHTIHIQTDEDIYFTFATSSSDSISTSNDLYLMGGDSVYSVRIPNGLGKDVYIQWERKGSSDATVRYVLA
jgi:hypothetical protein|tara:strand:- start:507 stop:839 length:333 start_codon:yes stop_codon:yes gene_type:complete